MPTKSDYPGATPFRQAMNCIGSLIFERGLRGDLDMSVTCRRTGESATTITVYHPDGVMNFVVTDEDRERDLTPRQHAARRALDEG